MAEFRTSLTTLFSFDGGSYENVEVARPDKLRFWKDLDSLSMPNAISRGAGLSYAAASFGKDTISLEHRAFNRLVNFDVKTGDFVVEAGADLWTCQRFLLGHGFFLPCHPGHGRITIGGCVAADVHGKNPWRDGTFSSQVNGLTLFHPDHGHLTLTRDGDAALLDLTCGGFGLTGHILSVTLAAQPLMSPNLSLERRVHASLAHALDDLAEAVQTAEFAYSWHDLSSRWGQHFVFVSTAISGDSEEATSAMAEAPPALDSRPRGLPFNLYNRLSIALVNAAYRVKTSRYQTPRSISIMEALFPIHGSETYFSLYGRPGFHEYQALIPLADAVAFTNAVQERAARRGVTTALCSAKAFGGNQRYLRFAGAGIAIAFNFPRAGRSRELMSDIDAMVIDLGGKPNIVKDGRLPAEVVQACYPEFEMFRRRLLEFDPKRRIRSELSERLEL